MEFPTSIPTSFAPDDPLLSRLIAAGVVGRQAPEGYVALRQNDGKRLKQNDGKQLYGKKPS